METLYHQTNKLVQQTQQYFQNLEANPNNYEGIEAEIQEKINQINRYSLLFLFCIETALNLN